MALRLTYEKKNVLVMPEARDLKLQQAALKLSQLREKLEAAEAEYAIARVQLLEEAQERRAAQLKKGIVENLKIAAPGAAPVQVLWPDKARKVLPIENVGELRRAFGADYSAVVQETEAISLRSGCTVAALRKRIGEEAFSKLQPLLRIREGVQAAPGATARAAAWMAEGDERGEDLLQFIEATHSAPCVRTR
jgi:hypothetical protein